MPVDKYSGDSRYSLELVLSVAETDVAGNRSRVAWRLDSTKASGDGYSGSSGDGVLSVDGQVWKDDSFSYNFTGGSPKTVLHSSGSKWITHDDDGSKSISYSASVELGSRGKADISGTFVLPRIPRGPRVKHGGAWRNTVVYVKHGGTWRIAIPYVKHGGTWRIGGG